MVEHRWSGWPGAWCLDCGAEDPVERCAASGHPLFCGMKACQKTECAEPNSHKHDPYWKEEEKEKRLKELASKVTVYFSEWNDPKDGI